MTRDRYSPNSRSTLDFWYTSPCVTYMLPQAGTQQMHGIRHSWISLMSTIHLDDCPSFVWLQAIRLVGIYDVSFVQHFIEQRLLKLSRGKFELLPSVLGPRRHCSELEFATAIKVSIDLRSVGLRALCELTRGFPAVVTMATCSDVSVLRVGTFGHPWPAFFFVFIVFFLLASFSLSLSSEEVMAGPRAGDRASTGYWSGWTKKTSLLTMFLLWRVSCQSVA